MGYQKNQFLQTNQMIRVSQKFIFLADSNSARSKIIKKQLSISSLKFVDLTAIVEKTDYPSQSQIEVFNPHTAEYQTFKRDGNGRFIVQAEFMDIDVVLLRLKLFLQTEDEVSAQGHKIHMDIGKDIKNRDRTRTIREIIEFVRVWRRLVREKGNGYNYQDAADALGLSKKSLDDYYYQLRVGEKYSFDFQAHLDQNIKTLRNFVKQKMPERSQKGKGDDKLPKTLKMFQDEEKQDKQKTKKEEQKQFTQIEQLEMLLPNHQSVSFRSRKVSQSDISSLQPIWFLQNQPNNNVEDQDSFFRAFRRDDDDFVEFGHLM